MISKYFPAKPLLYTVALLILNCQLLIGTVRYVSHNGSNTPPYTSWETAADSIMSAINISVFGDTIYVANGVYEEQVTMIPGLTLIGAGMDSCVIDTRFLTHPFNSVEIPDSCVFKYFQILVSSGEGGAGFVNGSFWGVFEGNKVINGNTGGRLWSSSMLVKDNIFENQALWGLNIQEFSGTHHPVIQNNHFAGATSGYDGVSVAFVTKVTVLNNTFFLNGEFARGYQGGNSDTVWIYNNLIVSENARYGFANSIVPTFTFNNFLIGNFNFKGINAENFNVVKNNNVMGSPRGIIQELGDNPVIQYNNAWNNEINYGGFIPDSTNLSVDPIVVSEDSLDFHLQMFSPLIDAGDPQILDIDGSRSDIGLYGGPYGERYEYNDLAPKPPRNLTVEVDSFIRLSWNRNTEADFNHYNLYRDTVKNFTIDTTKLISQQTDTFYIQVIPEEIESLYYKLTAEDNQGNESNPSEEVSVILVSVKEEWIAVNNYTLYQNYPNPFNPSTKIGYRLKERGYVKLYVYDVKGELIQVLVNQTQEAGYYEVVFSGERQDGRQETLAQRLASGIYVYRIMVKNENNIPVYSDIKKMILLR